MLSTPNDQRGPGSDPVTHEVDPSAYCDLAISSRRLIRMDDFRRGTRGFLDVETGERYVIEQHRLLQFVNVGSPTS